MLIVTGIFIFAVGSGRVAADGLHNGNNNGFIDTLKRGLVKTLAEVRH